MNRRRRAVITVASAAALIAGGAITAVGAGAIPLTGALDNPHRGDDWGSCLPDRADALVGIFLDYEDDGPVTLIDLRAVDPISLRIVKAYVVPVNADLRAGFQDFPPEDAATDPNWAKRVGMAGATIHSGQKRDLAIHVSRVRGQDASVKDFELTYRQGWRTFTVPLHTSVTFSNSCDDDDDE